MHYEEAKTKFLQELKEKGKLPNTIKNYKNDLSVFGTFLNQKEGEKAGSYYKKMSTILAQGFGDYLSGQYPKSNSKRRRLQVVRLFYDFLMKEKIVQENPIKTIPSFPRILDIPKPCPYQDIIKLWKHLETEIFLKDMKDEKPLSLNISLRNALLFILIYGSGLTIAQIGKLSQKSVVDGKKPRILVTPNKREAYSIPLLEIFIPFYKEYLKTLKALGKGETDHLFLAANHYALLDRPLSGRGVDLIFEGYRSRLRIDINPKNLRQACIMRWFNEEVPIENIKEWMGVAPNHDLSSYDDLKDTLVYQACFLFRD